MKLPKLPKPLVLSLAAPAMLALVVPAASLLAQGQTDTKIRLMSEALRARDSGDLDTAKKNLEELLAIAPSDATVQRLLAGVENQIALRTAAPAAASETAAPAATGEAAAPAVAATAPAKAGSKKDESAEADQLVKEENKRIKGLLADAKAKRSEARKLAKDGRFDDAAVVLTGAIASLPENPATTSTIADLQAEKNGLHMEKAQAALKQGHTEGARAALDAYAAATSDTKKVEKVARSIEATELNPPLQPIEKVSPGFIKDQKEIAKLVAKGRSQYLAGDLDGAQESFRAVETIDAGSPEAKSFLTRIASDKAKVGELNRGKSRAQMLEEVNNAWQRPGVYVDRGADATRAAVPQALAQKLASIVIPSVNFQGVELAKVVSTLSAVSEEYDKSEGVKGVNIILVDPTNKNPSVSITLRNLSLKRILDLISDSTGYQYEVQADTIVMRPGGDTSMLESAFFSVTKATVIRMTGIGAASATPAAAADPFATPSAGRAGAGGSSAGGESGAIQNFLEQAGVKFSTTAGSSLVYDGSAILVNQTSRNIEKIRNILNRYDNVKQVEIEAKFMEVQEGALEELGVNWSARQANRNATVAGITGRSLGTSNRTLASSFSATGGASQGALLDNGNLVDLNGDNATNSSDRFGSAPTFPGTNALGAASGNLFAGTAVFGELEVAASIRALSQKTGSDLLSSPKVTVLSGSPANIVVAQEMRYPQSYGETRSTVAAATTGGGGGGSVSITAGTPQEFTMRNVGVELKVTPTVEEDDYSITLDLSPKVTEFEGFVEYGGLSVAIGGDSTVTLPSGFYQPIFSTREITTKVTVWDGATLVMGGLTREEVKKTSDKVPVLGDIPFLGALFRSKGESTSKRNLLIFVTANLVSPGGSPKKQMLKSVAPSSTFQNQTIVTPGGPESRSRGGK
ncbi:MAG: type II secretory pathway, component PulD [Opitutus sp.]|nr:type II secretory pathway, component PulD [Opitutus sp.]MCS6248256.1 type II secretory pathway, component PulD [Opitutus sp.]MCS6274934.1 type II secretory pathway, component PulD [Opitutus sp.]MCS6299829.1 type II secretory pathway, component PulD [Opitutus sp.]